MPRANRSASKSIDANAIKSRSPAAIALVGFMGAGKSSVGLALAKRLTCSFEDLDQRIAEQEGRTVAEIFQQCGEKEFRRAEHESLKKILNDLSSQPITVIALGGGAFVQQRNAELLKDSGVPVVFLDATVDELWRRCAEQSVSVGYERPLLQNVHSFRELYRTRRPFYQKAGLQVETTGKEISKIVAEIVRELGLKGPVEE